MRRLISLAACLAAIGAFVATSASAAPSQHLPRISTSKLMTAGASQLGVSRANLVAAIQSSADAVIDGAVDDGDITSDQADDLKAEAADNLDYAYRLSRASTVASALGTTAAKLNAAFLAARKALLAAQVQAAQAAGTITADEASALTTQIGALTAGYKQGSALLGGGPGGGCDAGGSQPGGSGSGSSGPSSSDGGSSSTSR